VTDVACDACCMPPPSSICRFNTGCFMIAVGSMRPPISRSDECPAPAVVPSREMIRVPSIFNWRATSPYGDLRGCESVRSPLQRSAKI
jgi:hypothetical protein